MSSADIQWLSAPPADGPQPLQLLLEWLSHNAAEYHASSDKRELLGGLCSELKARGVPCQAQQLARSLSSLQELLRSTRELPQELQPFQDRLKEFLSREEEEEERVPFLNKKKIHRRRSTRLSWLKMAPSGGASAMEMLVEWLRSNYTLYTHTTRRGEKGRMLETLVGDMQAAGHHEAAVHPLRAKIDALQREVRGEKNRSTAYEQFGAVLEEIFTVGDAAEEQEEQETATSSPIIGDMENTREAADTSNEKSEFHLLSNAYDEGPLPTANDSRMLDKNDKQTEEGASAGASGRLSWMKPSLSGGPSAMELLVEWLQLHYAAYTHSSKKGEKGRMLNKLVHRIEDAGHRGCAMHGIRAKIDSLQRQAEGRMHPSAAFNQYGPALQKIFADADSGGHDGPSSFSPPFTVEHDNDEESSHDSDETMEEPSRDNLPTEQVEFQTAENSFIHSASPREVYSGPNQASMSFDIEVAEENHLTKLKSPPNVKNETGASSSSQSTSEILRIATLLRERHDLLQRGVPQEQVDKFLPLPNTGM